MATFSYDFDPGTEVFFVIEKETHNSVGKGNVLQVEFISNVDKDDNVTSEFEYLILDEDKETILVKPENVFATESQALNHAYQQLGATPTPTPTPSVTPTPSSP